MNCRNLLFRLLLSTTVRTWALSPKRPIKNQTQTVLHKRNQLSRKYIRVRRLGHQFRNLSARHLVSLRLENNNITLGRPPRRSLTVDWWPFIISKLLINQLVDLKNRHMCSTNQIPVDVKWKKTLLICIHIDKKGIKSLTYHGCLAIQIRYRRFVCLL